MVTCKTKEDYEALKTVLDKKKVRYTSDKNRLVVHFTVPEKHNLLELELISGTVFHLITSGNVGSLLGNLNIHNTIKATVHY